VKRLAVAALLVIALGLAACGDDETETVDSPGVDETSSFATTQSGSGPEGPLTAGGVGEVQRGDSTGQAAELFGEPDSTQKGPGCELAPDSPGALAWTYELGDGQLILSFDAASGELGYYRNTSPSLKTTLGDVVGDPYSSVAANWGGSLKRLPLGEPTGEDGIWVVGKAPNDQLLFDIRGGKVAAISGGHIEICE
jgi:hypothetical protein